MPLRILIIDDHRDYRTWLAQHLGVARPDANVIGHDPSAGELLPPDFDVAQWDLLFVDHRLGAQDGVALIEAIKALPGCPPVVFLAPQGDERAIVRALQAGADDFLSKGASSHEHILRVLRAALHARGRTAAGQAAPATRGEPEPEFRLKGHRMLKSLGRGAAAAVYLMERVNDERLVVAKVFRHVPDSTGQVEPLQRFLREYEVIASIRHPNVVRIFDLGIADDHAFIVMEYFPGGSLAENLGPGLAPARALDWLAQAARALEAIHGVGVLHRDLKPANMMLRADDRLALIDFGVAKLRNSATDLTSLGEIFGTPYYMSPEQGDGAPVDERADIYSLGVVFHEMLTGRKPYIAATPVGVIWKHRHAPRPLLPAGCAPCQLLLDRMMAKRPADRFPSAGALLEAIGVLETGEVRA